MNKEEIIQKTEQFVKDTLKDAEGGHDWWHIYRVWMLSKHIAKTQTFVKNKLLKLFLISDSDTIFIHNRDNLYIKNCVYKQKLFIFTKIKKLKN